MNYLNRALAGICIALLAGSGLCLAFGLLAPGCSSVSYREEVAQVANQADQTRLLTDLEALAALGPRRAGDQQVGEETVRYLEARLAELDIPSEREEFSLTAASRVTIYLKAEGTSEESLLALPETYFSAAASQAPVLLGLAASNGVADRVSGFSFETGKGVSVRQINLLATISGTQHPERVLELSAHHDTVPATVGGDDNTSGVVVLLEVARLLQEHPPQCSVRLCFFAAEELGLLGSQEHIARLRASDSLDSVFGLINLDAVGYFTDEEDSQTTPVRIPFVVWPPYTGNFLAILGGHGSSSLAYLTQSCGEVYAPDLPLYSLAHLGGSFADARRSDHANYWDAGIPAIFLTDTGEFRSDHYHRPTDGIEELDLVKLRDVAVMVTAAALEASSRAAD